MGFSRQEYWSGLPLPSPGDLLNPGIEPGSPGLQADCLHVIVVSVCLPSDALSQGLQSYSVFSYLGCGDSLHGCSSKIQTLLLTLDVG